MYKYEKPPHREAGPLGFAGQPRNLTSQDNSFLCVSGQGPYAENNEHYSRENDERNHSKGLRKRLCSDYVHTLLQQWISLNIYHSLSVFSRTPVANLILIFVNVFGLYLCLFADIRPHKLNILGKPILYL